MQELIKFSMMHGGMKNIDVIDSVIADALSPRSDGSQGLSAEDSENISNLYLEVISFLHVLNYMWLIFILLLISYFLMIQFNQIIFSKFYKRCTCAGHCCLSMLQSCCLPSKKRT